MGKTPDAIFVACCVVAFMYGLGAAGISCLVALIFTQQVFMLLTSVIIGWSVFTAVLLWLIAGSPSS